MSLASWSGVEPCRVRDLPAEERPRERLARHGAAALSSRELLAILIGTGSARESALSLAQGLLGSARMRVRLEREEAP